LLFSLSWRFDLAGTRTAVAIHGVAIVALFREPDLVDAIPAELLQTIGGATIFTQLVAIVAFLSDPGLENTVATVGWRYAVDAVVGVDDDDLRVS
jgi:hypothetical protein